MSSISPAPTVVTASVPLTSSGGASPNIAVQAAGLPYADLQDVSATLRFLGRITAGAGVIEEIPYSAAGLNLFNDADVAAQLATLGLTLIAAASQAEMEAAASNTVIATPLNVKYNPGVAKAWAVFDSLGTFTILSSYGISSLTDVGIGRFTANFSVAFSSANFCVCGTAQTVTTGSPAPTVSVFGAPSSASCPIGIRNGGTLEDFDGNYLIFFGDQ